MTVHEFPRDHGSLGNLDKDHHPQYLAESETSKYAPKIASGVFEGMLLWGKEPYPNNAIRLDNSPDFNDESIPSGFYSLNAAANAPTSNSWHYLLQQRHWAPNSETTGYVLQYAVPLTDPVNTSFQLWMRRKYSGTWFPWKLVGGAESWSTPTFENGWVNYGSPYASAGYRMEAGHTVRLKGLVKNGTVVSTIFTLPVGYRPTETLILPVTSNNAFGEIRILNTGPVQAYTPSTNNWIALDGVSFQAEQ